MGVGGGRAGGGQVGERWKKTYFYLCGGVVCFFWLSLPLKGALLGNCTEDWTGCQNQN